MPKDPSVDRLKGFVAIQVLYTRDSNGKADIRDSMREPVGLNFLRLRNLGAAFACQVVAKFVELCVKVLARIFAVHARKCRGFGMQPVRTHN